jgi:hypothetical protein
MARIAVRNEISLTNTREALECFKQKRPGSRWAAEPVFQ